MINSYNLISWLKYLDVNYLDDDICETLSRFNINNPLDQDEIIKLAILPEFFLLNEISKKELKQTLVELESYSDEELLKITTLVGMPFNEELADYKAFFRKVQGLVCKDEA